MKKFFYSKVFTYGLFWSWNLLYVFLFAALELEAGFAINIIRDGFTGKAPVDFTIIAMLAYLIPFISIILGFTILKKQPVKLVKLFYGAEVPLTLICLLRLSVFRETTTGTTHLLILLLAGMGTFLFEILWSKGVSGKNQARSMLAFNTLLLLIGVYIGLVLVFYLPPAVVGFLYMLGEIDFLDVLQVGFLLILALVFFLYSITLLLGLPAAMLYLYLRQFYGRFTWFSRAFGQQEGYWISGSVIVINLLLFYFLNWNQPQEGLFERLATVNGSKEEVTELVKDEAKVKEGLLNAYLASYRYLGEESRNRHIAEIYREAFGGEREHYSFFQESHNILLKPFLYAGKSIREDQQKAERYYEELFDASLQKDEREKIKHALNSTWERDIAEAGLLDIGEEKVRVLEQDVRIKEEGDVAEIEIYEVYQNQTFQQQEILCYFSLPENAVLTGMWISDEPNKRKFPYRVSPRGAAQQVYKQEVSRRVDPSLLEQVGPNQYRLRAFPVEPKRNEWADEDGRRGKRTIKEGEKFYLWLQYRTLAFASSWPMPVALQRRNVYCDDETKFTVNGTEADKESESDWLPASLQASGKVVPQNHITRLEQGNSVQAVPAENSSGDIIPENKSFAVVLDGSYSMNKRRDELEQEWQWLEEQKVFDRNKVDVFLTGLYPEILSSEAVELDDIRFFGNHNLLELLHQVDTLKQKNYDAILVLTDQGNYEGGEDSTGSLEFAAPLYFVHLGHQLPYAYQDNLLETLEKSGGKSFTGSKQVFQYMHMQEKNKDNPAFISCENGYLWLISDKEGEEETSFQALAAKQFIKKYTPGDKEERLAAMDKIHELAKKYSIVTPYSSMICLVNDRQLQDLEEAENSEDRFDRETETGKQIMPNSGFSFSEVSGTPEPEEWVLIILAGAICLYLTVRKRWPGVVS